MAWKYPYPRRENYETEQEYEDACEKYEQAESDYAEAYMEEQSMEKWLASTNTSTD